jgi:hypothetical protein
MNYNVESKVTLMKFSITLKSSGVPYTLNGSPAHGCFLVSSGSYVDLPLHVRNSFCIITNASKKVFTTGS